MRRPHSRLGAGVFAGDLAVTLGFAMLVAAGFAARRHATAHKRLMTLASAAIVSPALARWPFDFMQNGPPLGVVALYLIPPVSMVVYDLATLRRVQHATWFGGCVMLAALASFRVLPAWPSWSRVAGWVAGS